MLHELRERKPLVHQITNYVVMNETANATLALGALPVMAHAREEVEEMVALAGARSEEHTSELQSQSNLVCRLLLEKKKFTTAASVACRTPGPYPRMYASARTKTPKLPANAFTLLMDSGRTGSIAIHQPSFSASMVT